MGKKLVSKLSIWLCLKLFPMKPNFFARYVAYTALLFCYILVSPSLKYNIGFIDKLISDLSTF